jgi:hypothetical protein
MCAVRGVTLCALLCALAVACGTSASTSTELVYTVGGCQEEQETSRAAAGDGLQIVVRGEAIHVGHRLSYVCCAELSLSMEQDGNTIRVVERNVGEMCRCVCEYDVEADINGLGSGVYQVEVWGVEYEDVHTPELLGQASVQL